MTICFELTMPQNNSWNGKWSGDKNLYARTMSARSKKSARKYQAIVDHGPYYYDFGDGWAASVSARKIDPLEARKIRRRSRGFAGYDWMIESILINGKISTRTLNRNHQPQG